jgi:hypothetical protein
MKVSKTAIFLFELMFVILIFTVSAVICSNIFAKAYSFSNDSKELTMAVLKAESAAEVFKSDVIAGDSASDLVSYTGPNGLLFFDKDWHDTTEDKAYYTLSHTPASASDEAVGLREMEISVTKSANNSDVTIFSLVVSAYGEE